MRGALEEELPPKNHVGHKSNSLGSDQVQFVVQDRKRQYAVSKFSLIDLELLAA